VNKPNGSLQARAQLQSTTKQKGDAAEDRALRHLQTHGFLFIKFLISFIANVSA